MRYEKPLVIDLNSTARGAGPRLCVDGGAASGIDESCATGTGATWTCSGGSGPSDVADICVGGGSPGYLNDCASGGSATGWCEIGASGRNDPNGCRTGPSFD